MGKTANRNSNDHSYLSIYGGAEIAGWLAAALLAFVQRLVAQARAG